MLGAAARRQGKSDAEVPKHGWAAPSGSFVLELADTTSARRTATLKPTQIINEHWMPGELLRQCLGIYHDSRSRFRARDPAVPPLLMISRHCQEVHAAASFRI